MEPVLETVDLLPLPHWVVENREQDVDAVEDNAPRVHHLGLRGEAGEHALDVEVAALDDR